MESWRGGEGGRGGGGGFGGAKRLGKWRVRRLFCIHESWLIGACDSFFKYYCEVFTLCNFLLLLSYEQ